MTANQATYAAILAMDDAASRRPDPVRAQVGRGQLSEPLQATQAYRPEVPAEYRGLHLIPDTRDTRPRGPHPGDVLYWVACLGGACLLLLSATT